MWSFIETVRIESNRGTWYALVMFKLEAAGLGPGRAAAILG